MRYLVRRGRSHGAWTIEAPVATAATALRILERWVREHPREWIEVEGIAGVFVMYVPPQGAGLEGEEHGQA
jgi:hypothetical protein